MHFLVKFLQMKMNLFSWSDHSVPFLTCRIKIKMCFYLCRMFGYLHISTSSSSSLDFRVVFTSENTSCSHTHFLFLHPLWLLTPCLQTRLWVQSLFLTCFFFFSLQEISLCMSHSVCQNLSEPQESVQQVNVGSRVRLDVCWSSEL